MEVIKDGRVWCASDEEFNIHVSGDTKLEAMTNLTQAVEVLRKRICLLGP